MKVVLLIDSLCSGGAQTQLVGLAKMLSDEKGIDVCIASYYEDLFWQQELMVYGINNEVIPRSKSKLKRIGQVLSYFKKEEPDYVISFLDAPNTIACICHAIWPNFNLIVSERNTTQSYNFRAWIMYRLFRQANYIVPNSYSQTSFIKANVEGLIDKVKTITNFVDADKFSLKDSGGINDKIVIMTAARINAQKNIIRYIEAISLLMEKGRNISVLWYGRSDSDRLFEDCKQMLKNYGLEDVFTFKDATQRISEEYKKADIFCLPSVFEGFPNAICEAMCCGLPIACSNVCDNPIIVEDDVNGCLFDPLDAFSIADGIDRCIELLQTNKSINELNREKMLHLCSKDSFIKKYLDLLK